MSLDWQFLKIVHIKKYIKKFKHPVNSRLITLFISSFLKISQMAQDLTELMAFPKDLGLIPGLHMVPHNYLITPVLEDTVPTSGLSGHCRHAVHRCTFRQSPKQTDKKK